MRGKKDWETFLGEKNATTNEPDNVPESVRRTCEEKKKFLGQKRNTNGPENVPKGVRKDTWRKPSCVLREALADIG